MANSPVEGVLGEEQTEKSQALASNPGPVRGGVSLEHGDRRQEEPTGSRSAYAPVPD